MIHIVRLVSTTPFYNFEAGTLTPV